MKVTPLRRAIPVVPAIHQALRRGVEEGAFPGGAAAVFLDGQVVHLSATGDAQLVPAPAALKAEAHFDLASLTKVLATTAAAAMLVGRRQLGLDDVAVRYWPEFGRAGKRAVTVRALLAHCSGLPAFKPFFLSVMTDAGAAPLFRGQPDHDARLAACRRGRTLTLDAICATPLEREPGAQAVYSDLGFIALGRVLELVSGERLDRLVAREVYPELGLASLRYRPLDEKPRPAPQLVATGLFRPREPAPGQEALIPPPDAATAPEARAGEVDDDNAFAMGGVSGHAGLFGDARDVAAFGQAILEELDGASRLAPRATWQAFAARDRTAGSSRALGFDTPCGPSPAAGGAMAASRTLGHTGFTGTSLWIDLERRLSVALLTNRTHPSRANVQIARFRPIFHDAVIDSLELPPATR